MMNTICEPYTFEIDDKSFPIGLLFRAIIMCIDGFQSLANSYALTTVLVPKYITPPECCFCQVVNQKFLTERQKTESWHLIAQQLQIGKAFLQCVERLNHGL